MSFDPLDLYELDKLLSTAEAVIPMADVAVGNTEPEYIALRHDVDDNQHSFKTAMNMARWEESRGYRSTYFVLHTASYWNDSPFFRAGLEEIASCGHEIGIHTNALAEALRTGGDPDEILMAAIDELRGWGHEIVGVASHGDTLCYDASFVNYDQFTECARKGVDPFRTLTHQGVSLELDPLPLGWFGLEYESYHLPKGAYLSDSGGQWSFRGQLANPAKLPSYEGQLHVLQHPDWWHDAISPHHAEAAAA